MSKLQETPVSGRSSAMSRSTKRMLSELPSHIQRDIGWPVSQMPDNRFAILFGAIWSAAR